MMAEMPLVCCFEGDYGYKILMVEERDTMDVVAEKAASKLVGVVVPRPAQGSQLRVRQQGADDFLPRATTVSAAGLTAMDPVEIISVMP